MLGMRDEGNLHMVGSGPVAVPLPDRSEEVPSSDAGSDAAKIAKGLQV